VNHTEATLQKLVFREYAKTSIVVPNAYFRNSRWEMDTLVVTKAGFTHEFEIKTTKADFMNELKSKKYKHKYMSGGWGGTRYFPNYYSILCPEDIVTLEDVDLLSGQYGLFHANKYWMRAVRRPKRLHSEKIGPEDYRKLCIKLMYKVFNHCDKYRIVTRQ